MNLTRHCDLGHSCKITASRIKKVDKFHINSIVQILKSMLTDFSCKQN